jgi:hypothetical protein
MLFPDIAVATITLARQPSEERLLLSSLEALSRVGLRVAVADGGSPAPFVKALRQLPGLKVRVVREPRSLLRQVRTAFDCAREWRTKALLYTEPDKEDFFSTHLVRVLRESLEGNFAHGVSVAARSPEAFLTFPVTQRLTEDVLNRLCGALTGVHTDYSYGPFVLEPRMADYLDTLPDDIGWGWRPFVFALAGRLNHPVSSVVGDFVCPEADRAESAADRTHRMRQLAQNVAGLVRAVELRVATK